MRQNLRTIDYSNGYEDHAFEFLKARESSSIGAKIVDAWARSLGSGAEIIELGCGGGVPVTKTLFNAGLKIRAIDASPTLIREFRSRFPSIPAKCEPAQLSDYFGLDYDAAISIGLLVLLDAPSQLSMIPRVSAILKPGARFLFTAPAEIGRWKDSITHRESVSLGRALYAKTLRDSGFRVVGTYKDEGENNYYEAEKLPKSPRSRVKIAHPLHEMRRPAGQRAFQTSGGIG
ncbi:MAG: class I SAM-dependent methyltransferase [Thiohalocapsa sp.]